MGPGQAFSPATMRNLVNMYRAHGQDDLVTHMIKKSLGIRPQKARILTEAIMRLKNGQTNRNRNIAANVLLNQVVNYATANRGEASVYGAAMKRAVKRKFFGKMLMAGGVGLAAVAAAAPRAVRTVGRTARTHPKKTMALSAALLAATAVKWAPKLLSRMRRITPRNGTPNRNR